MTIQQFLALPSVDDVRHELDEGKLLTTPLPLPRHQRIVGRLSRKLADFVDRHNLGEVFPAGTPFVLGRDPDTLRGPDLTFLRGERVALIDEDQAIEGPADLTVEVISPDDTPDQVLRKVRQYLAAGGLEVWLVFSAEQEVHIFRSGQALPDVCEMGQQVQSPALLPGFSLLVDDLFSGHHPATKAG